MANKIKTCLIIITVLLFDLAAIAQTPQKAIGLCAKADAAMEIHNYKVDNEIYETIYPGNNSVLFY